VQQLSALVIGHDPHFHVEVWTAVRSETGPDGRIHTIDELLGRWPALRWDQQFEFYTAPVGLDVADHAQLI
jgi:hypothetical protein